MLLKVTKQAGGLGGITGSTGQVLVKTGSGETEYEWQTPANTSISNGNSSVSITGTDGNVVLDAHTGSVHKVQVNGSDVATIGANSASFVVPFSVVQGEQSTASSTVRATNSSFDATVSEVVANKAANTDFDFISALANTTNPVFRVRGDGRVSTDSSSGLVTGGADFAEFFEWQDGNPDGEDRAGVTVIIEQGKIRSAQKGESPDGVITASASVIGDAHDLSWKNKYVKDPYGRVQYEEVTYYTWETESGTQIAYDGEEVPKDATKGTTTRPKINPDYDPTQEYTPREKRPEFDAVGLLGKIPVRSDQVIPKRWKKLDKINDEVSLYLVR